MMNIDPTGLPMMNAREIEIVTSLLRSKPNMDCLEWGAGNSTLVFPNEGNVGSWLSIENDIEYAYYVDTHNTNPRVSVWYEPRLTQYIDSVKDRTFDFILVDGMDGSREQCLDMAMKIARPDAIVLLHDAGRTEYQPFMNKYKFEMLSQGEIPYPNGFFAHRGLARFYL